MSNADRASNIDMNIELILVPVSDAERAKRFYGSLGWRLDIDYAGADGYRVIQFTPPGSGCSIMFGGGITTAEPGSLQGMHLIVSDLDAARRDLLSRGIDISEMFHDPGGVFHHSDAEKLRSGPNPQRRSYATYASFRDPDGNGWVFQEVTARLSGDVQLGDPRFTSEVVAAIRGG